MQTIFNQMKNFFLNFPLVSALILCAKINFSEAGQFILADNKIPSSLKKNLTYEDFEHENKGCPENSICDEQMGLHRKKWLNLLKKIDLQKMKEAKKVGLIENFRQKHGLPTHFYIQLEEAKQKRPIVWSSECKLHQQNKIYLGEAFVSKTNKNEATWHKGKEKKQYELLFDPIIVYRGKKKLKFYAPKGETPLYLDGDELVFVREDEGVFYGLKISTQGKWTVISSKGHNNSRYIAGLEDTKCPSQTEFNKDIYQSQYCRKIWDKTKKEFQIIRFVWSC